MKNLELESFGLVEMNHDEMLEVDGGGWVGDALRWLGYHWEEVINEAIKIIEALK